MKLDENHFKNGIVGAMIDPSSIIEFNVLSNHGNGTISSFFDISSYRGESLMFERVEANADVGVFLTTKGKKNHRVSSYNFRQWDEVKHSLRSKIIGVGYEPYKKCKPCFSKIETIL